MYTVANLESSKITEYVHVKYVILSCLWYCDIVIILLCRTMYLCCSLIPRPSHVTTLKMWEGLRTRLSLLFSICVCRFGMEFHKLSNSMSQYHRNRSMAWQLEGGGLVPKKIKTVPAPGASSAIMR